MAQSLIVRRRFNGLKLERGALVLMVGIMKRLKELKWDVYIIMNDSLIICEIGDRRLS